MYWDLENNNDMVSVVALWKPLTISSHLLVVDWRVLPSVIVPRQGTIKTVSRRLPQGWGSDDTRSKAVSLVLLPPSLNIRKWRWTTSIRLLTRGVRVLWGKDDDQRFQKLAGINLLHKLVRRMEVGLVSKIYLQCSILEELKLSWRNNSDWVVGNCTRSKA